MSKVIPLIVDQNEIKFAMAANLSLLSLGWVLNSWIPITISFFSMLLGSTTLSIAPYSAIYKNILTPLKIIKTHEIPDDPLPHRFASLVGGSITFLGTIFLWLDMSAIGWTFVIIVFTLQSLNLWVNFCMMYSMYYILNRLGVPGFTNAR